MTTFWKALETFLIGLAVVVIGGIIQSVTNYHPTGVSESIWAVISVAIIGGLRGLLSWLILKQNSLSTKEEPK